jgi:hypothetical protein
MPLQETLPCHRLVPCCDKSIRYLNVTSNNNPMLIVIGNLDPVSIIKEVCTKNSLDY